MVEQREAEDASRLEALRSAVRVGIADFEQGRYATFESGAELRGYLASVASKAVHPEATSRIGDFDGCGMLLPNEDAPGAGPDFRIILCGLPRFSYGLIELDLATHGG